MCSTMAAVPAKLKKEDLRKLMRERRENAHKEKVDSPFAKYNSSGQLFCIICNLHIKTNSLWPSHITGKVHKENVQKKKKGTADSAKKIIVNVGEKRPATQPAGETGIVKKLKTTSEESLEEPQLVNKNAKKPALLKGYSSSSSEDEDNNLDNPLPTGTTINTLPADFFDPAPSESHLSTSGENKDEKMSVDPPNDVKSLPEGFFDDPFLDAKVRHREYKDPVEEEWEKFQKAIAEETNVSKTIMEEDLEESTLERDIIQIDEQIHEWERSKNLQCQAEVVKIKAPAKQTDGDKSGSTDDELEEDDLLDWRSKGVKKL